MTHAIGALLIVVGIQAAAIGALLVQRTRRIEVERDLRESEERYRRIADCAPVMILTARPDTTLDYLNRTCVEFTGLPLEKLRDEGWLDAVHPDDRDYCTGTYGPAFLTLKNYYVIKEYNFSDLYVLFVGSLADRIAGGGAFVTPWSKASQLHTTDVERMQQTLTKLGMYQDKIDGKAGMLTRAALGTYQKANGLKLDCWPTAAVLEHMRRGQ